MQKIFVDQTPQHKFCTIIIMCTATPTSTKNTPTFLAWRVGFCGKGVPTSLEGGGALLERGWGGGAG